jgi:MFS family permease
VSTETIVFIFGWIVCALIGAAIGYAKKRLALGAILGVAGGLIGVAIIACIPKKEEKSEPPVLTAHDLRHRYRAIIVLSIVYGLLGLLLLPWPIASYAAIFFFDAPIRSLGDEISRYLAAFAIWLYPVFYGIALVVSLASLRKKKSLPVITLPALLPLLPPLCLFVFLSLWGKK